MSAKTNVYVGRSVRTIALMTLMTSLVWTSYSIYSAVIKPIDVDVKADLLKPVDPSLDTDTLTLLTQKRQISEDTQAAEFLRESLIQTASPAPATINNIEISPVASSSASPTPVPTASTL